MPLYNSGVNATAKIAQRKIRVYIWKWGTQITERYTYVCGEYI